MYCDTQYPVMLHDKIGTSSAQPMGGGGKLWRAVRHFCRRFLTTWKTAQVRNDHPERFYALARPFLSRLTWAEIAAASQQGGGELPTALRQATILCLDIVDFSGVMAAYPLAHLVTLLDAYLAEMTGIVHSYGGEVDKYLGDGLLAVFESADEAVRAGWAIQQATRRFQIRQTGGKEPAFSARVGVATGEVAVTSLGSRQRRDRTVIGPPVNLADRLQGQARPGRVWLSRGTFEQLSGWSACHFVGQLRLKGWAEPVAVYEIYS